MKSEICLSQILSFILLLAERNSQADNPYNLVVNLQCGANIFIGCLVVKT
jgi:hypothetical protein